jgi:hypothetical protein
VDLEWVNWVLPPDGPTAYTWDDDTVTDGVTGLVWQRVVSGFLVNWGPAKSLCEDLVLGGWDDWRLPTVVELRSIVDHTRGNPAINSDAFPNAAAGVYWSASPPAYGNTVAWCVAIGYGYSSLNNVNNFARVRCVR